MLQEFGRKLRASPKRWAASSAQLIRSKCCTNRTCVYANATWSVDMHSGGTSMALRRAEICATVERMAQSRRSADQTPDLFDAAPSRREQPQARSYSPAKTPYILPADLPSALSRLSDPELRRLTDAVTAELQRRNPPVTTPPPSSARDSASSFPKIKKTLPELAGTQSGPGRHHDRQA